MTYFEALVAVKEDLVRELSERGIQPRYLIFGGAERAPDRKPSVPTASRSEFLANRAMGDWAEDLLAQAIRRANPEWTIGHYGNAGRMAAGDSGFKEFYLSVAEEVRKYGKRPDLLIFDKEVEGREDLADMPFDELDQLARKAKAAIEVRSSKFEATRYMKARKKDREDGNRSALETLSFTVKVEDLKIVYRWIERYGVPQSYCQVFYDAVYCINFLDIFRIIASGEGYRIDKPAKSQLKATIFVPITSGTDIRVSGELPNFRAEVRITRLGRHDAYVVPEGGSLEVSPDALLSVLLPPL